MDSDTIYMALLTAVYATDILCITAAYSVCVVGSIMQARASVDNGYLSLKRSAYARESELEVKLRREVHLWVKN